jgi:hypothetical protein
LTDSTLALFDETSPHETSRRIVREWEVNGLVEEFEEVFFGALLRLAGTTYDGDSCLVGDEFTFPFGKGLLDSRRVRRIRLLLLGALLLFAFFLGWPDFVALIDVDD